MIFAIDNRKRAELKIGLDGSADSAAVVIREATPQEVDDWDALVMRFENYRIFQKTNWLQSIEASSGARRLHLVFQKNNEIVACLPGLLFKKSWLRIFGSPLVGWQTETMGPAFDPDKISTHEICKHLISFLQDRYGVQHIELATALFDDREAGELGFRCKPQFTYRVPLFPGNEMRAMGNIRPKTRNQLRKALKLGLVVRVENEESFVDEFYDQLTEVFTRRGKTLPFNRNRVLQIFRHMKEAGSLLAISVLLPDGSKSIATGLFMFEAKELHLWGWAHRTQYRWYCPVELLTWTAMQKGMEEGCVSLDMAGGGNAKEKFGAVPDNTVSRLQWSRYEWLAQLRSSAEKAYRYQQFIRGLLAQKQHTLGQKHPKVERG